MHDTQYEAADLVPGMIDFAELVKYPATEQGMADLFIGGNVERMRHCPDLARWFVYDGQRWKRDDPAHLIVQAHVQALGRSVVLLRRKTAEAVRLAREEGADNLKRLEANEKLIASYASQFSSRGKIRSIVGLASSDVRIRVEVEDLDSDEYLINFRNGTFDVRAGRIRSHEPDDMITKVVDRHLDLSLGSSPELVPLWREGLLRQADGELELAAALERALAYGLLGSNPEQRIFFLKGASGIGKSKSLEIVADLFEDYSGRASVDLLLVQKHGRHDAVLAKLVGSHFSIISETEEHQQVDLPAIKDLTGANKITARYLHQQQFDARVTWTIYVSTNDLPVIVDMDRAMMRRMVLIQLSERERDARDIDLDWARKIIDREGSALCARLMLRLHEWYLGYRATSADPERPTTGLIEHPSFVAALDQYQRANDSVAEFVSDMITVDPEVKDRSTAVLRAYNKHCLDAGVPHLTRNRFWERMRSLTGCSNGSGGVVTGIALSAPARRW